MPRAEGRVSDSDERCVILTDEGARVPLSDVVLERSQLTAHMAQQVAVPAAVRIDIAHRGRQPGSVRLLARVKALRFERGGTDLVLEPRMLHTTAGEPCLREFVASRLGSAVARGVGFECRPTGAFFSFDPPPPSRKARLPRPRKPASARGTSRVEVSIPALGRVDGVSERVHVFRLEDEGGVIYIRTEGTLPVESARVDLMLAVLDGRALERVHLAGDVDWRLRADDGREGGTFRVRIAHADCSTDPAEWRRHVVRLAAGAPPRRPVGVSGREAA